MVYQKIRQMAKERNESIKEVAEKAGISEITIYRWRNENKPTTRALAKVAEVLGTSPAELLEDNEEDDKMLVEIMDKVRKMSHKERLKLLEIMLIIF